MKVTPRFTVRAALVLAAAGVIGAFGACKDGSGPPVTPPPPVPPPPPPILAPTALSATTTGASTVALAWTDNANNETGYRVERCSGAGCASFAQIGADLAANTVAFDDVGLTASTAYSYRVRAFNASATSDFSNKLDVSTGAIASPSFVMIGAGEITSCNSTASNLTAALIDAELATTPNAIIYTVGNNLNDSTPSANWSCFDSRWGKFKANANFKVALGQRDYDVGRPALGTDAVYAYFGDKAGAPNGWYSFDVGTTWRVIVLNSSTWQHGAANLTDFSSAQNTWLANVLAADPRKCTVAIFNTRRYYSYGSMENGNAKTVWNILHTGGADVMLSGTDKYYERWAPQNHDMARDDAAGIRQFIVGTGGRTLDNFGAVWKPVAEVPNLEVRDASVHGVLKLTLNADSYDWQFIPTVPGGFSDSGTAACH